MFKIVALNLYKWLNIFIYIYAFIIKVIRARESLTEVMVSGSNMLSSNTKLPLMKDHCWPLLFICFGNKKKM